MHQAESSQLGPNFSFSGEPRMSTEARSDMPLEGRVALVTGGGRGIGRAIAIAFANAGARVAVTARSQEQIADVCNTGIASGGSMLGIPADLSEPGVPHRVVEQVAVHWKP